MWKAFFGWKSSNFIILAPPRTFPPPGKFPRYATTSLPTLFSRVGGKSPIFTRTTLPRTIFKGWEDKSIIFARIWASLLYFQRGGGKSTILTQIQPFLEFLLKEGRIRVPYFFYIKTSLHTIFFTRCLIVKKKNEVFQMSLLLGWKGGGGSISLAIVQMLSSSHWDLYYEYVICLKGVGDKHQHWQDHLGYIWLRKHSRKY